MRIIYDHQIVGSQTFGGVSRYVYELARAMATTHGQDARVLAPIFTNQYLRTAPAALKIIGLPILPVRRTGRLVLAINSFLAPPVMRYLSPDIIHETYYSRRRIGPRAAKTVLTVYDMIHERCPEHFPASDTTRRDKATAVARADHVICISEQTRRDLLQFLGIDSSKTSVVHLGFSQMAQSGDDAPIQADRPFLLYVGHRRGYKNFDALLRTYVDSAHLKRSVDLVCFGGPPFSRSELASFRTFGLSPTQVRHRSGDDAALASHYRAARALVYPSLYEGFGIPPLEAMSYDCPVACSNAGSIPEIVGDAGELFDPRQVETMRTAIERVVDDRVHRARLIASGRERIHLFSWQRCAEETLAVYRRAMAS